MCAGGIKLDKNGLRGAHTNTGGCLGGYNIPDVY